MKTCTSCGSPLFEGDRTCSECGARATDLAGDGRLRHRVRQDAFVDHLEARAGPSRVAGVLLGLICLGIALMGLVGGAMSAWNRASFALTGIGLGSLALVSRIGGWKRIPLFGVLADARAGRTLFTASALAFLLFFVGGGEPGTSTASQRPTATITPDALTICAVRGEPVISYPSSVYTAVDGEVRCSVAAKRVKISGTFFDATGRLIGASYTYADLDEIQAGGFSSFRILVNGSATIASHKLQVEAVPR